jgi:hypothetical protein
MRCCWSSCCPLEGSRKGAVAEGLSYHMVCQRSLSVPAGSMVPGQWWSAYPSGRDTACRLRQWYHVDERDTACRLVVPGTTTGVVSGQFDIVVYCDTQGAGPPNE